MAQLIISCSLSPKSRSAVMAAKLLESMQAGGAEAKLIDLRETPLPFCDAGECYADSNVQRLQSEISAASAIAIATPIYNYGVGGATRNLIALTGKAWTEKVVGFACAAGGQGSYMAVMNIANSLMLDFRSVIVPRFVYAHGASFDESRLTDEDVVERIAGLAADLSRFGRALSPA